MIDHGIALLEIQLKAHPGSRYGERFYFLVPGTDGADDVIQRLQDGWSGVRLKTQRPQPVFSRHGLTRCCKQTTYLVTDAQPMYLHAEAIAWASGVDDEVELLPLDQLADAIGGETHWVLPADAISAFLDQREKADEE